MYMCPICVQYVHPPPVESGASLAVCYGQHCLRGLTETGLYGTEGEGSVQYCGD